MASGVVDRIREKLSRRRHSFTGSLKSARSTASSIRSGHTHGQPDCGHDDDPRQSRSVTPSQVASQLHDHDPDPDLGLSSSSSSASSTTTTTRTSHDHGDDKLRRESGSKDELVAHEKPQTEAQAQAQTRTSEEKTDCSEGDGGAASEGPGRERGESLTASVQVQAANVAAKAPAKAPARAIGTTPAASTVASADSLCPSPSPAAIPAAAPAAPAAPAGPAASAGLAAPCDPPNRHPNSLLSSPPSTSTTTSTLPSPATAAPVPGKSNLPITIAIPSTQKPVPPPLGRTNSWQYRGQLQAIDEDSDPPSPTTVTSPVNSNHPKTAIADSSVTSTSDDNSSIGGGGGEDNDSSDDDDGNHDGIDQRLNRIQEERDKKKAAAAHCPRSRHANKQLTVTVTEPSASQPPQTQTQTQTRELFQTPAAAAAVDTALSTQFLQAAATSPRKQSLFRTDNKHSNLIKTLLENQGLTDDEDETASLILPVAELEVIMTTRKIWVKRPGASATLVAIKEDDLVDDVRDTILTKYGNSLGKTFDSPDLTLRIVPREQSSQKERLLGPEEPMCRTLDTFFPGGQSVGEALLIDTPAPRRNPRPSPRAHALYPDSMQPPENGEGYFPPVAMGGMPSPHRGIVLQAPPATTTAPTHSIAVINTGHIPNVPSPGGTRPRYNREQTNRPKLNRTHTQSPTIVGERHPSGPKSTGSDPPTHRPSHSRAQSNSSDHQKNAGAAPLPGSPVAPTQQVRVATPPPRVTSPRSSTASKIRKAKKLASEPQHPSMLNGTVPPISVLIVEDNPINLKLLEAFVKKLKVRWSTAMNGRDAVTKWRSGGFHLVLMDIQLPVMNGLDATREIRRLERVNSIGVFTSSSSVNGLSEGASDDGGELKDEDRLEDMSLFKSPVIIVALTASSLQSDRHEALAAGCNDFLTKPVNFVWLERKVMEWGCMQALIDFDGWRKWKDFSEAQAKEASTKVVGRSRVKKNRTSTLAAVTTTS